MKTVLKEKLIVKSDKIQEILDCISEIKKTDNSNLKLIRNIEKKCYDIITKTCFIRWCQRLRQKQINNRKIIKKGLIFRIK